MHIISIGHSFPHCQWLYVPHWLTHYRYPQDVTPSGSFNKLCIYQVHSIRFFFGQNFNHFERLLTISIYIYIYNIALYLTLIVGDSGGRLVGRGGGADSSTSDCTPLLYTVTSDGSTGIWEEEEEGRGGTWAVCTVWGGTCVSAGTGDAGRRGGTGDDDGRRGTGDEGRGGTGGIGGGSLGRITCM